MSPKQYKPPGVSPKAPRKSTRTWDVTKRLDDLPEAQQTLFHQNENSSPLLRLPRELRNQVLSQVLQPRKIWPSWGSTQDYFWSQAAPWFEERPVHLWLVCRQLYSEVLPVLYARSEISSYGAKGFFEKQPKCVRNFVTTLYIHQISIGSFRSFHREPDLLTFFRYSGLLKMLPNIKRFLIHYRSLEEMRDMIYNDNQVLAGQGRKRMGEALEIMEKRFPGSVLEVFVNLRGQERLALFDMDMMFA